MQASLSIFFFLNDKYIGAIFKIVLIKKKKLKSLWGPSHNVALPLPARQ